MAAAAIYDESDWLPAAVLSAAVHLLLLGVLVFGVSWQSRHPEAVVVELWASPRAPEAEPVVEVKPVVEPKPVVAPKPLPKVEREPEKPPQKPDIAIEKVKKIPPKKAEPKLDLDLSKQNKDQAARELDAVQRSREKSEVLSQFKPAPSGAPSGGPRVDPTYVNRIVTRIKSNIVLPRNIVGNPEAIIDIEQLPTGDVVSVKFRKSSGVRALDEAVERAIIKSSPLPRPDRPEQYQRVIELIYHPFD